MKDLLDKIIEKRPAEAITGLALAGSVYGFLSERGVSQPVAAVIGIAIGFLPAVVSETVDRVRG